MIEKNFIQDNLGFLIPFWLFLFMSVIGFLAFEQGYFIHLASEYRGPFQNSFFKYTTIAGEEWAFFVVGIISLFVSRKFTLQIAIVGITCLVLSALLKMFFAHPRPAFQMISYFQDEFVMVSGVKPHIGYTSFPSGHTMAGFALFSSISFHTKNKGFQFLLLFIAVIVGLSRIYLGHHFLKDIILGSILGYYVALFIFRLFSKTKILNREKANQTNK